MCKFIHLHLFSDFSRLIKRPGQMRIRVDEICKSVLLPNLWRNNSHHSFKLNFTAMKKSSFSQMKKPGKEEAGHNMTYITLLLITRVTKINEMSWHSAKETRKCLARTFCSLIIIILRSYKFNLFLFSLGCEKWELWNKSIDLLQFLILFVLLDLTLFYWNWTQLRMMPSTLRTPKNFS